MTWEVGSMRGVRRDPERLEVQMLLRHAPLLGARVLDVGCGDGRLTRRIAGVAQTVVLVDPDAGQFARADRRTSRGREGHPEAPARSPGGRYLPPPLVLSHAGYS